MLQDIKEVRVHSIMKWRKDLLDQEPKENGPDEWEIPLLEVVSLPIKLQNRLRGF